MQPRESSAPLRPRAPRTVRSTHSRNDQAAYRQWLQELRQLAGNEAFERELAIGAALTLDEAIEFAFDLARRAGANLNSP